VFHDTGDAGSAWLKALQGARERLLTSYARYPYTTGAHAEVVVDQDAEKEARKARKRAKLAEAAQAALKGAGAYTGFIDDDDEERMAKIVAEAATKAVNTALEQDARRVDPKSRPDHTTATGTDSEGEDDARSQLPDGLKSVTGVKVGGAVVNKTITLPLSPGGLRGHSVEADRVLDEHVAKALVKSISINRFPRNFDAGDFCISRYCLAREMFPYEGQRAFGKYAPKESAYYEALDSYAKDVKALGEMTSGQDGGQGGPAA
jgi:hypothetical protein